MIVVLAVAALLQAGHVASHVVVSGEVQSWKLADLDGDGDTDLILATVDESGRRTLRVHPQEQGVVFSAEPSLEIAVPRAVICWATGNFLDEPGHEIVFFSRDAVWIRPAEGRLQKLHEAPMLLDMPSSEQLPSWRPVHDIDGDGFDEIAIVTARGFRVIDATGRLRADISLRATYGRVPTAAGAFLGGSLRATLSSEELSDLLVPNEEAGVLEPPPALFAEVSLPRPEFVDVDGDGLIDLSWVDSGSVHVRFQTPAGDFPAQAGLKLELPSEDEFEHGYLAWRDAGGGKAADLLLTRSNRGAVSFSSDWQALIWLDPAVQGALGDPDAFLKAEAGYLRVHMGDWNSDGQSDLALSAWSVDAGLLAGSQAAVDHKLSLYIAKDGGWNSRPALVHERRYSLDDVSAFRDLDALIADATGDGAADLLESDESGVLEIRRIFPGPPLRLQKEPSFRISVDALSASVVVQDLNEDGITDFLVAKKGLWQMHLSYRL